MIIKHVTLILSILIFGGCMQEYKGNYDAVVYNRSDNLLYLIESRVLSYNGDQLGSYNGNTLLNHVGQEIAYLENGKIYNTRGQVLGSVTHDSILNHNGDKLVSVSGSSELDRLKVASYFFFL